MDRIDAIIRHPVFTESLNKIEKYEKDRIFCCHRLDHALDVSRIAYILCLEKNIPIKKDVVYAAGLLHDIGRWQEYENGTPHNKASAAMAETVMKDTGYTSEETCMVLDAILRHRSREDSNDFTGVFYDADKLSRPCFRCQAADECYWPDDKRNHTVIV